MNVCHQMDLYVPLVRLKALGLEKLDSGVRRAWETAGFEDVATSRRAWASTRSAEHRALGFLFIFQLLGLLSFGFVRRVPSWCKCLTPADSGSLSSMTWMWESSG